MSVSARPPPGWPGEGWVATDAAFRPEFGAGALHLRYERDGRYASLFLLPRPRALGHSPATTYDRPGLRVKLLPEAERVVLLVEMLE